MQTIPTKTTFLEMLCPPAERLAPPRAGLSMQCVVRPTAAEYRRWYQAVGGTLTWVDRLIMPDDELQAILDDPRVQVLLFEVGGATAGYAELAARQAGDVELAYFGLFPQYVGQGFGKFFLNWTLHHAWAPCPPEAVAPMRVWLHTCDRDHPNALPTYQRAGFRIYDERTIDQSLPAGFEAGASASGEKGASGSVSAG